MLVLGLVLGQGLVIVLGNQEPVTRNQLPTILDYFYNYTLLFALNIRDRRSF